MPAWTQSRQAAERFAERREREAEAPRLRALVPTLESLELTIRHESEGRRCPEPGYVRRIQVATGPGLIWVPCSHAHCVPGGHDITGAIVRALAARRTEFDGTSRCDGEVGTGSCRRVLHYDARADLSRSMS